MRATSIDLCPALRLEDMPAGLLRVLVAHSGTLGQALTDAQGRLLWLSTGFEAACGSTAHLHGESIAALFGDPQDQELAWLCEPGLHGQTRTLRCWRGPGARQWFRISARALDASSGTRARALVTLDPAPAQGGAPDSAPIHLLGSPAPVRPAPAANELVRLTLLLEVAQKFGRLGVWDHDPRTGNGHWDRHVWRLFGVDADQDTPSPELALTRVHPADVATLNDLYAPVRPGGYSRRFRVIHRGGGVRRLEAQFIVEGDANGAPTRVYGVMRDETEATQASQSLEIAHEQLRLAVDLANLAIWRHDLRTDTLHQSAHTWTMLGLPVPANETCRGDDMHALVHPDDLPRLLESARMAKRTGQPHETTARMRRGDGSWCHTLVRRILLRDDTGQPQSFLGVTLDITAQIEESHRVLQSEHRLALATEAASVALWEIDLHDGRVTWNRQMMRLHGVESGAALPDFNAWVDAYVHPDDRDRMLAEGRLLMAQRRGQCEVQCRILRTDGSTRWVINRVQVEPRGDTQVVLGVMTDVTSLMLAQAQLHTATERAALATRSAGIGTWEHDLITDTAVWDEQMFTLRGLLPRPQALTRDERLALVHPDDIGPMEAQLKAATLTGASCRYEFRVRLPDGRWRRLASRSVVLRDTLGRLCRQIGVNWEVVPDAPGTAHNAHPAGSADESPQ